VVTLSQSDVLFFITALSTIIVVGCVVVISYYLIHILSDVRVIVRHARNASDEIEENVLKMRDGIKSAGSYVKTAVDLVLGFIARSVPKTRTKKK